MTYFQKRELIKQLEELTIDIVRLNGDVGKESGRRKLVSVSRRLEHIKELAKQ